MTETPLQRFERLAEEFYKETGIIAPGKDVPAEMNTTEDNIYRWDRWMQWMRDREAAGQS